MPITSISDVVVPEVFDDYFLERSIYKSNLYRSGIVVTNPKFNELLDGGAEMFSFPFWDTNTIENSDATPVDEDADVTPDKITAAKMIIRRHMREKSWTQNDVAAVLAGSNPSGALMEIIERFWNRNLQKFLLNSIIGVLAENVATNSGDLLNNQSTKDIDSDIIIDTIGLFGDDTADIQAIAMHSKVHQTLQKDNLVDNDADNAESIGWGTYLGKAVIVDDILVDGGIYHTIVFKPGAFGYGESSEGFVQTEVDRDPAKSGGRSSLYSRRCFMMHPNGMSWKESTQVTKTFPTDANLKSADQWERVVAGPKNCGFAVLKTKG